MMCLMRTEVHFRDFPSGRRWSSSVFGKLPPIQSGPITDPLSLFVLRGIHTLCESSLYRLYRRRGVTLRLSPWF